MKAHNKIALLLGCMVITSTLFGSHNCCVAQLTAANVQAILDAINIIRPNIISIRIEIEELLSCCEDLRSSIDNITVEVEVSLNDQLDSCCELIISRLDNLVVTVEVSGLDQVQSCCEIINSKIGDLDDPGTCLDSQIDVPEDINNLNLTIIALLKTILLELRGCPCQ